MSIRPGTQKGGGPLGPPPDGALLWVEPHRLVLWNFSPVPKEMQMKSGREVPTGAVKLQVPLSHRNGLFRGDENVGKQARGWSRDPSY